MLLCRILSNYAWLLCTVCGLGVAIFIPGGLGGGNMINYPIGIQTFEKIRSGDFLYVDKTKYIYELAHRYQYVFLSRPRRFGKSLLVSTFESYFRGKKDLLMGWPLRI